MDDGFLLLADAGELFKKLEHDFTELQNNHNDTFMAFNFFVTAEHLPDWIGDTGIKDNNPYLRISSHLATGAKHFRVTNRKKDSVASASIDVYVKEGYVEEDYFYTELVLHLTDKEEKDLGINTISVLNLAEEVMQFWRNHFDENYA